MEISYVGDAAELAQVDRPKTAECVEYAKMAEVATKEQFGVGDGFKGDARVN